MNAPLPSSSPSHSFDLQQIAASLEDKLDIRMNRFEKSLNDMKAFVTSPAPIKVVEKVYVTCGANHSYNHCPLTRSGNEFPIFHDNIQQFQTAVVGNFVQGNLEESKEKSSVNEPPEVELKEFSDELTHINPEITKSDFDFKEETRLIENLLYDNSSTRPQEELNVEIANTIFESFPSSLITVQDSDSQREEIDIVTNTDELLPHGFENDDSEGEIDVVVELHVDNSISNSEHELSDNEASDFDNSSFLRPPPEPPDAEFDVEISVVMNTIDELECLDP
nr:hypothetical protein [Tanacetum cinerariifolium]